MNSHAAYFALDLVGTFVFAMSGAVAARQKRLDLFGILSIAFMVACGGGIVRDVCIGAIPPAGLSNWRYLAASVLATAVAIFAYAPVRRLRQPVLFFDAIGLGLFAVAGAQKALSFGHNAELAILLGSQRASRRRIACVDVRIRQHPGLHDCMLTACRPAQGRCGFVLLFQVQRDALV
ncbi:trimeric intracellular cation channel family protein [Burkholderia sp. Bp8998]|uniref:trimeric intracellular cation channel family protein n=1 Tax=Burkholderia sp. Bp8998 TaxID=2184557 RepID=UPI0021AB4981|nr:TRIC cation channel family protein [Burkholderia sp. Bp8998]